MADGTDPNTTPQDFDPPPSMDRGIPYVADPSLQQMASNILAAQNTPPPAGMDAPVQMPSQLPDMPTPTSPDVQEHMSWMHRALDRVGSILGGDKTYKLTKHPDGSTSIEEQDSTTGEKWGRIAAAAIAGAGAGLANSQGPNALSRAAGAGIQTGAGLPEQARKEKMEQVDFQNKQLLQSANYNHIKQQSYLLGTQGKLANLQYNQTVKAMLQQNLDDLTNDDPNAKIVGTVDPSEPHALANLSAKIPDLAKLITGSGNKEIVPVPTADGKFNLVVKDKAWMKRRNSKPLPIYALDQDEKGNWDFKQVDTVPVNGTTNEEYQTDLLNTFTRGSVALKNMEDAKAKARGPADKPLDSSAKAYDAWRQETDPQKKAGLWQQYTQLLADEKDKRAITHVSVGGAPSQGSLENWGALLANPQSGITMAQVPPKMRTAVVDYMSQSGQQPAIKLGADELKRMDLANIALQNLQDARDVLDSRPDLFGPKGFAKKTFADWIKGGDPDAHKFQTAIKLANLPLVGIHAVRGKYAVDDLAKEDADLYHNADAMGEILDEATRAATQISRSGGRKLPAENTKQSNTPQKHTLADVPPGATAGRNKAGDIVGYQDAKGTWHNF